MDRIVSERLRFHLDQINILTQAQSGFRRGYSCATILTAVTDDILHGLDSLRSTALILLDFLRAFDTVDHDLLLAIMHFIGLSYLHGRSQRVKLSGVLSDRLYLTSAVPQGSILDPLLFIIYTSQLFSCLKYCSFHLYTDDSQLCYSFDVSDVELAYVKVNHDLGELLSSAKAHCLRIHPYKSSVLLFSVQSESFLPL